MKGTTVQLQIDSIPVVDEFGTEIESQTFEDVEDVLVGQPSTDDYTSSVNLYGKHIAYMLGIPKGDQHDWKNKVVIIWGKKFRTFGDPMTGESENIPLRWGQNVRVEAYS